MIRKGMYTQFIAAWKCFEDILVCEAKGLATTNAAAPPPRGFQVEYKFICKGQKVATALPAAAGHYACRDGADEGLIAGFANHNVVERLCFLKLLDNLEHSTRRPSEYVVSPLDAAELACRMRFTLQP